MQSDTLRELIETRRKIEHQLKSANDRTEIGHLRVALCAIELKLKRNKGNSDLWKRYGNDESSAPGQ